MSIRVQRSALLRVPPGGPNHQPRARLRKGPGSRPVSRDGARLGRRRGIRAMAVWLAPMLGGRPGQGPCSGIRARTVCPMPMGSRPEHRPRGALPGRAALLRPVPPARGVARPSPMMSVLPGWSRTVISPMTGSGWRVTSPAARARSGTRQPTSARPARSEESMRRVARSMGEWARSAMSSRLRSTRLGTTLPGPSQRFQGHGHQRRLRRIEGRASGHSRRTRPTTSAYRSRIRPGRACSVRARAPRTPTSRAACRVHSVRQPESCRTWTASAGARSSRHLPSARERVPASRTGPSRRHHRGGRDGQVSRQGTHHPLEPVLPVIPPGRSWLAPRLRQRSLPSGPVWFRRVFHEPGGLRLRGSLGALSGRSPSWKSRPEDRRAYAVRPSSP
jgi:hypothetical protein